jgi:hypothetical protein
MRYLFAFRDTATCETFRNALEAVGILCDIRNAESFPDGTQGPEIWVRDEDYESASNLINEIQNER